MRTFSVKKYVTNGRPGLVIRDEDNNTHRLVQAGGMEMARLYAMVAIKQRLALEESPMPECGACHGGVMNINNEFMLCQEPACREWYENAHTICDRVEVCIKADEEVGVIEL